MKIGSTPTHEFSIAPIPMSRVANVEITYQQSGEIIFQKYLSDMQVNGERLTLTLTEEETFMFQDRKDVKIQPRIKTTTGEVIVGNIITVSADECLSNKVMPSEN